jgi:predicted MFS family arabinose efflux permease
MLLLALTGIPEHERGSVVGTFSAFFDFANGAGGFLLGAAVALTSYAGAFSLGAALAAVSLTMLRAGFGRDHERLAAGVAPAAGT